LTGEREEDGDILAAATILLLGASGDRVENTRWGEAWW